MKKNIKKTLTILILIILLTGCALKMNVNMTIAKNKNIKASILMAMDNQMIDAAITASKTDDIPNNISDIKEYTDKERWDYLESDDSPLTQDFKDFELQKYDKDGYKGFIATKDLGSIDELSTTSKERQNILGTDDAFDEKLFVKESNNLYSSNMKVNIEDSESELNTYKSYINALNFKLIIEFPNIPLSHNADEVSTDGKTLTWNLLDSKDIDFKFDFKKSGKIIKEKNIDKDLTETIDKKEQNKLKLFFVLVIIGIFLFIAAITTVIIVIVIHTNKKYNQNPVQTIIEKPQTEIKESNEFEEKNDENKTE